MAQLKVTKLADAATLTAAANYTFTSDHHKVLSVQAVWTATTASATLTLQLSNDGATWDNFTTATAITNASGNVSWYLDAKDALYVRVALGYTSGTVTTLKVYAANVAR